MRNISLLSQMEGSFNNKIKGLQRLQTVSWTKLMFSVLRLHAIIFKHLSGEFLLNILFFSTGLALLASIDFSLNLEWRERVLSFHLSQSRFNPFFFCFLWPCIDFPSHRLSDWPAEGMCNDSWPALTPLTSQIVNTDMLHTVLQSGL